MPDPAVPDPHDQPTTPHLHQAGATPSPAQTGRVSAMSSTISGQSFVGCEFGDYEIVEEIGRGGMGVVYKARQKKLNRIVALKMIIGGRLASEDDLKRFLMEAEASARLQHSHIVTVYEVDEIDGHHFFSMEFVEGKSLAQQLSAGPLPGKKAAEYMATAARALAFAHENGFLHRDLKPSNIMVDKNDQPRVMDFGLTKHVGDTSGRTETGVVLGTPSYMSPEQASGKVKNVNHAADIYGLGAVLYELLTGKPPFQSDTQLDTLLHVVHSDPVPPRLLNPKIDLDLENICLKCLEKNPKDRYVSAQELSDDLSRYIRGESIKARSSNMLDRITRFFERSHHDVAFHAWSKMLFWLAGIIFAEHLAIFALARIGAPEWLLMLTRASQFVLIGIIFWYNRKSHILPRTAAERELWTIWSGYVISYAGAFLVIKLILAQDWLTIREQEGSMQFDNLILYPISSLLSGLAFFVMGSNYWGRCYAIGLAFIGVAVLSTFDLSWAPLAFGILWAIALTSVGWHLRVLNKAQIEHALLALSDSEETIDNAPPK